MSFFQTIKKRRSIRSFSSKSVEKSKIQKILKSSCMSPSAKGLQNYKIFVIEDPKKKENLVKAAHDQEYVNSVLVLVFCADPKRIKFMGTRGEKLLAVQDATIAASYAQLAVTALGLSSVWVGHFKEKAVAQILKTKLRPVVILPVGYGNEKPMSKKNQKMKNIIKQI
ncbi:MAG: nitroreductase family protein [Nitrosopumilus sp.]|nr:nitroreductase family protein [Nitrosopumilus sp.]